MLFHLVTRFVHSILWARSLSTSELFYLGEIFPLQVATTIWNDCRLLFFSLPLGVHHMDTHARCTLEACLSRSYELFTRLRVYVLLRGLRIILALVERSMFFIWHVIFRDGITNRFPMPIKREYPHVVGYDMFLSERKLTGLKQFAAALIRDDCAATMT